MNQGSCLCGGITYQIQDEIGPIIYCHCQRCRKSSGSAFVTSTEILRSQFEVTAGHDLVQVYRVEGSLDRAFCQKCGSQLYSLRDATPKTMRVRMGTLDTVITKKVSSHIFVGSKASWDDILDTAPQYLERP
ncbi:MAG: GFA family protein [Polynucleobacter sp.]|nr:GFA family protein [Polynucleobacter sp.]